MPCVLWSQHDTASRLGWDDVLALVQSAGSLKAVRRLDRATADAHAAAAAEDAAMRARQDNQIAGAIRSHASGPSRFRAEHFHTLGDQRGGTDPHRDPQLPQIRSQRLCSWSSREQGTG